MEGYGYPYPPQFPPGRGPGGEYPDHGDGFGEYYGMSPLNDDISKRPSCSKYRNYKHGKRSRSHESVTKSRSRSRSKSRSRSRSGSRSKSRSRSHSRTRSRTHSRSASRHRDVNYKEPGILDAFRVMYLTPSKHKKSTTKYLATKKKQDRITEILKSDGLGSKRWLFYPRPRAKSEPTEVGQVPGTRDNCDQRVKVDADFLRKYKKSKKIDADAPIAKLKRWELIFYQKLGFIQAI